MPYCPGCGSPAEGRFCPQCGRQLDPEGATAEPSPGASAPLSAAGLSDNAASALCYVLLLITGILFLILAPYNRNRKVRFHAFQAIFLHLIFILIWMVSVSLHWLWFVISPVISLGFVIVWIFMIVKSYQGERIVLPLIGPLAEKQA